MSKRLPKSALEYVLLAFVPYTEQNIKLSFAPKQFFRDLETISRNKQRTLRNAYYQAVRSGLVDNSVKHHPRLTQSGLDQVRRFSATKLGHNAHLMVIFDIPELQKYKRQRLRRLLRELKFIQVQKSVWVTEYDFKQVVLNEVRFLELRGYVKVYECADITP